MALRVPRDDAPLLATADCDRVPMDKRWVDRTRRRHLGAPGEVDKT
jgi:hypothetical protein